MTVQDRLKVQREPRRQLNGRVAWLMREDDPTKHECSVYDVAPGGARVGTDIGIDIGDRLSLVLVASHDKRQPCKVVWRRGNTFGLKFLT